MCLRKQCRLSKFGQLEPDQSHLRFQKKIGKAIEYNSRSELECCLYCHIVKTNIDSRKHARKVLN